VREVSEAGAFYSPGWVHGGLGAPGMVTMSKGGRGENAAG
jgi:hypothetical protein